MTIPSIETVRREGEGPWYFQLEDIMIPFERAFEEILGFHRTSRRLFAQDFERAVEDMSQTLNPEYHDYGDVYYEAEKDVGAGYEEFRQHLGLMVLIRAVALAELTLARVAAEFFKDPEGIVFTKGRTWTRKDALSFFATALVQPCKLDSLGMDTIAELRNHYAHGYGQFLDSESAEQLEARLQVVIGDHAATPGELALGFEDEIHVLGRHGTAFPDLLTPSAHLSALAVDRLLHVVGRTVRAAVDAAQWGPKEGDDLERSRFVKDWKKRNGEAGAGDVELDYKGPVSIRYSGKRVELVEGRAEQLIERMRDGLYDARIELTNFRDANNATDAD